MTRISVGLLLIGMVAATQAMADCGIILPDPSCPMGTFGYMAQQFQDQRNAAAAADPRNQNDPGSPYYLGTPAQQCEAAKRSLYCVIGISCAPPSHLNCGQYEPKEGANRRRRHY